MSGSPCSPVTQTLVPEPASPGATPSSSPRRPLPDGDYPDKGPSTWGISCDDADTRKPPLWRHLLDNDFFISQPWDLSYYWTVRGSENLHIYLWIAKDLAWAESWYWPAMLFGSAAVLWCFVLLHHAVAARNYEEIYMWVGLTLWLVANFVWMAGEVFNDDDDFVVPRAAHVMEAAIAWILAFHLFLKPLGVFQSYDYANSPYDRPGLVPRFSYFRHWRQYENAHTLCWLGKDLSWNRLAPVPWVLCLVPTLLIAADFVFVTGHPKRRMLDDAAHYLAQLLWVVGNLLWALGNLFVDADTDDDPRFVFQMRPRGAHMRWYAAWALFAALWPIALLYCVWLPLTVSGHFRRSAARTGDGAVDSERGEAGVAGAAAVAVAVAVTNALHR
eukprot:gene14852-10620_t